MKLFNKILDIVFGEDCMRLAMGYTCNNRKCLGNKPH